MDGDDGKRSRPGVALASLVCASALGISAWLLPERMEWVTTAVAAFLGLGYLATGLSTLFARRRFVVLARATSWFSLLAFGVLAARLAWWGWYLKSLYGQLGLAVAGGLLVFGLALALFLVPLALHLLATTPRLRRSSRGKSSRASAVVVLFVGAAIGTLLSRQAAASGAEDSSIGSDVGTPFAVSLVASSFQEAAKTRELKWNAQGLGRSGRVRCPGPFTSGRRVVLTFRDLKKVRQICLDPVDSGFKARVQDLLTKDVSSRRMVVDVIEVNGRLNREESPLNALSVRPGLDGVCAGSFCQLAWQLVIRDRFHSYKPIPTVADAAFGVESQQLLKGLKAGKDEPLLRVTAQSFLLTVSADSAQSPHVELQPLRRMKRDVVSVNAESLNSAMKAASSHLVGAQDERGLFRYRLNPYTGWEDRASLNLPRHSGTLLAMCEYASSGKKKRRVIQGGLDALNERYVDDGPLGFFTLGGRTAGLGDTALAAIAIMECERRGFAVEPKQAEKILNFLMLMQRSDGSFRNQFHRKEKLAMNGKARESLFTAGQAVYALVLMEQFFQQAEGDGRASEAAQRSGEAAARAMTYYGGEYWDRAPASYFYIDENWHCLAARAALSSRRDHRYEQFCLDYVTFKTRLLLGTDADPGFVGGYAVSPLFPPHGGPTAGFAEASSAALALVQARGESRPDLVEALERSLSYLMSLQLQKKTCFACKGTVGLGAFPESPGSPMIRIDFVQHALAGMGHARDVLGWAPKEEH